MLRGKHGLKASSRVLMLKNGTILHYVPVDPSPMPWKEVVGALHKLNRKSLKPKFVKSVTSNFRKAFFSQYFHDDPRSEEILRTLVKKTKSSGVKELSLMLRQGKVRDDLLYETLVSVILVNLAVPPTFDKFDSFINTTSNKEILTSMPEPPKKPEIKKDAISPVLSPRFLGDSSNTDIQKKASIPKEALNINLETSKNPAALQDVLLQDFIPENDESSKDFSASSEKSLEPINLDSLQDFLSNAEAKKKVLTFFENSKVPFPKTFDWNQNSFEVPKRQKVSLSDVFFSNKSKYVDADYSKQRMPDLAQDKQYLMYDVSENTEYILKPVDLLMIKLEKKDLFEVINGCTSKQPQHILEIINTYLLDDMTKWNVYGTVAGSSNKIVFAKELPKQRASKSPKLNTALKITTVVLLVSLASIGLYDFS